jgi:hypothetical protein
MQQNSQNPMLQQQMQDCIQDCLNCAQVCQDKANSMQGQNTDQVNLLLDCAELCTTAAHFMQHSSPVYGYVCQACAQVCTHLEDVSAQAGMDDIANACKNCAYSCQQIVKMVAF